MKLKCVAISDLHNDFPDLSGGDVLIIGGDLTTRGSEEELTKAKYWLNTQRPKFKHILFTPGNHDLSFETDRELAEGWLGQKALINEVVEIEGVKFFLSPYSLQFGSWAFMKPENTLTYAVSTWPLDVDVAVVHGPAYGIRDVVWRGDHWTGDSVGSHSIKWWLNKAIDKGRLRAFIFGHIHESFGVEIFRDTLMMNVAQGYSPNWKINQRPVVFTIDTETKFIQVLES